MQKYFLTEISTKDKLIHQGIYFEPSKKSDVAMLWVHGLTSTFYNNLTINNAFAEECERYGWGYASFNNRGHDQLAGIKKVDHRKARGFTRYLAGAGMEVFTDCIYDIDAGITFLYNQGYKKVILVGHSTGANKVCFYAGTRRDIRVTGVVLSSPMSDRLLPFVPNPTKALEDMQKMIDDGHGDQLVLGYHFFPITTRRYVSLMGTRTDEDVFDYGDLKPTMHIYRKIKKPLLVVFGAKDDAADRPIKRIQKVFDAYSCSSLYESIVIPETFHSFEGKEDVFVTSISNWIQKILI